MHTYTRVAYQRSHSPFRRLLNSQTHFYNRKKKLKENFPPKKVKIWFNNIDALSSPFI